MEYNEQETEYWYDIYGLCENRDVPTIETFLSHFADRKRIEPREKDVIFLVPDISTANKQKLFENQSSLEIESQTHRAHAFAAINRPETVQGVTISQILALGVARRDQSFSLYSYKYTRKDVKCLLVHFTVDNKVILGVAVNKKDASGRDNWPHAQKIKQELESIMPIQFSTIWFEQYPSDSEAEFIKANTYFGNLNEDEREAALYPYSLLPNDSFRDAYYYTYRKELHRQYRQLKYAPNLTDYFTISNDKGQFYNGISFHEGILGRREAQNPQAIDVVALLHLGDLLTQTLSRGITGFNPTTILRVSIPPGTGTEPIWQGHRDGVSNFTTYEGVKTTRLVVEDTYHLNKLEDLKRLGQEGFFRFTQAFFHSATVEAYEKWLVQRQHDQLYLDILQDEDPLLKVNVDVLLKLFGRKDWPKFLSYLLTLRVSPEALKYFLRDMCHDDSLSVGQVADMLHMVSLTDEELEGLIDIFLPAYSSDKSNWRQSDKYQLLKSIRKEAPPLSSLISEMKASMNNERPWEAVAFIRSNLQIIEKEYGSFYDAYLIFRWATREAYKDLLPAALKLLPVNKWRSNDMLNMGLITSNEAILQNLTLSSEAIEKIRQKVTAPLLDTQQNLTDLIRTAIWQRNYFQLAYLAPQLDPKDLVTLLLEACKRGMVGIAKFLVEQGHAAPDCFYNSPIKFANKEGFYLLRQYLLSKGVRDERF